MKLSSRFLSFITAVILALSLFPSDVASASESQLNIYDYAVGTGNDNYKLMFDNLAENPTFNPYDTIVFTYNQYVKFFSYSKCRTYKQGDLTYYDVIQSNGSTIPYASTILTSSGVTFINHESQMHNANLTFTFEELKTLDFSYLYSGITLTPSRTRYCHLRVSGSQYSCADDLSVFYTSSNFVFLPTFIDDFEVALPPNLGFSVSSTLGIDKDSFAEWLINFNKLDDIAEAGLDVPASKVKLLVDFYDRYGGSPLVFVATFPAFLIQHNLLSLSVDTIKAVYITIKDLYAQYLRYLRSPVWDTVYGPHLPDFIIPNTKEDDTLITDTDTDTTDISLLREILRAVLNIPQYIDYSTGFLGRQLEDLIYYINMLSSHFDILPNNIAYSVHNVFIEPINKIIEALENIDSDTTVEVEIPEDKEKELEVFFDDWSDKFSESLSNKFPVLSQISELFSDFFEKCGVDTSSDSQNNHYYESVSYASFRSRDSGSNPVTLMKEVFPNADSGFLDVYSPDIPSITINIKGEDVTVFDFRLYAKYRKYIFSIISFILWIGFLLGLYKSSPTIIGRVSAIKDVVVNSKGDDS